MLTTFRPMAMAASTLAYTANSVLLFMAIMAALDTRSVALQGGRLNVAIKKHVEAGRKPYYVLFFLCVLISYASLAIRIIMDRNWLIAVHCLLLSVMMGFTSCVFYRSVRELRGKLKISRNDNGHMATGLRNLVRTNVVLVAIAVGLLGLV